MLPLYLSIEGLYSYQHKQEIDFTKLTEAGLFGIFGKVGSGKSSIIEAISFALYGETERLNKQERRTYNMLNLKSDAACIVFDFLNFEGRKFRFVAQWKRKKKFEETSTLERYAYTWKDDNWLPLASADGAEVTRLNYPNFRRTIIIPQGQFKEFLELRGKDRSDMMKEIFHLGRFDLGPKVSTLQRKNNNRLEGLKGALSGFEAVSIEILQAKQEELENTQTRLTSVKAETTALEIELTRLTESKRLRTDLQHKKVTADALEAEQPKMQQQERELEVYEVTQAAFREILNQTQLLNKEKELVTHKLEQLSTKKQQVLARLDEKETEWQKIATDYAQIEQFRAETEDLKLLIQVVKQLEQKKILSKRLEDGKPHLLKAQEEERLLNEQVKQAEERLEELRHKKVDTTALLALESWYQQQDNFSSKLQELHARKSSLSDEIDRTKQTFQQLNVSVDGWEQTCKQTEIEWNQQLLQLQQEETQLKVQSKLKEFAESLENGIPCPLCGAIEHPDRMVAHDLAAREIAWQEQQMAIQQNLVQLKENFQLLTRASIIRQDKQDQLAILDEQLGAANEQLQKHRSNFIWTDFSASDKTAFLAYKDKNQLAEEAVKATESAWKATRSQAVAAQAKVEKYRVSLAEFEQNLVVIDSLVQQNIAQLRVLAATEPAQWKEATLVNRKQQLDNRIRYLEDSYRALTESIQQLKTELATVNGQRSSAKEQFQQLYQQLGARQAELSGLLKAHGYDDIIQVQQILQKQLNIAQIRKAIQEFNVNLQTLRGQVHDLERKIAADGYSEIIYEEKLHVYQVKKEALELQIRVVGALEKECAHLQVEFAKKEKLIEEYDRLNLRKSNLTTLENLFRGAGFVNYVSSIHLQRLCEIANLRFHRLTKNNLSLTINENNEFEVVDYLNNGFRRSVKTLSGGQSFQASLCLALALAESIQSLNKADKNFFFIDEGFGTQDADSMNTVFETLQYLHRENRIVGIISHVEELKERIPRAVNVVNDSEKGSIVSYHNE
ncbi:SMC family ATPase [Sphingobacterium oryzagri]|uniref:SMC family ATPase n=1 Tax=Sphingobacterium oryzagri TaxID=3025669 RepID=A0ABY7WKS5_9SPHI|nr:SMC family ATPase [Sphingobacterium sp. KACC 22765]WDF70115.1 SMC family ATPase [Sphingobacterium sp. KACC 22765]